MFAIKMNVLRGGSDIAKKKGLFEIATALNS